MTPSEPHHRADGPLVSLVVVMHNALPYVRRLLRSLPRTRGVDYELVVVDNRSRQPMRAYLALRAIRGRIQRMCLLECNTLFSPANNIAAAAASRSARYFHLLLPARESLGVRATVLIHRARLRARSVRLGGCCVVFC